MPCHHKGRKDWLNGLIVPITSDWRRRCVVCDADISHKRLGVKTCGKSHSQMVYKNGVERARELYQLSLSKRECVVCGKDISNKQWSAKTCSREHASDLSHANGDVELARSTHKRRLLQSKKRLCLVCDADISHKRMNDVTCSRDHSTLNIRHGVKRARELYQRRLQKVRTDD